MRKIHSERTLRRHLAEMDLYLHKSRARSWSIYDQQGYMIMDYRKGWPILQSGDYSLTLEEVDAFVFDDAETETV